MYCVHISVHVIRLVDKLKCVGLLLQINAVVCCGVQTLPLYYMA